MTGGKIINNSSILVAGLCLKEGNVQLLGGEISGNKSKNNCSGVAAGMWGTTKCPVTLVIGNNMVVKDNYSSCERSGYDFSGGKLNNVYLASGCVITIDQSKAPAWSGTIGVTAATAPTINNPTPITTANCASYASYFSSDDPDYCINTTDNGTIVLDRYTITITADSDEKTYDGEALTKNSYTYTSSGLPENVRVESAVVSGTITKAGSIDNTVSNAVIKRGDTDVTDKYNISYVNGTLKVNKLQLKISGTAANDKTYDGTADAKATCGSLTNKVGNDDVTVTILKSEFADKNARDKKDVKITYSISGNDSDNYLVPEEENVKASITPLQLTVEGTTVEDKIYDGTATAKVNAGNLVGALADDDVSLSFATGTFDNEKVGENKTVTVTYVLQGSGAANYAPKTDTFTASIKPQPSSSGSYSQKIIIVVEPITLDTLPEAVQNAINEAIKSKNLELVATIQVYELNGNSRIDIGRAQFKFDASILDGKDPGTLRAWKINDDNTMTEVTFEIVDGNIIFNNGELGTYILTA